MTEAASFRRTDLETASAAPAAIAAEPKLSLRLRFLLLVAAALAAWGVVILLGYGLYSLIV